MALPISNAPKNLQAKHVRRWGKKFTSGIHRQESKKILRDELKTT
jgi:hypothetical protein